MQIVCSSTSKILYCCCCQLKSSWFMFMNCTSKKHWLGAVVRLLLSPWPRNVSKGSKKAVIFSCSVPHELFLAVFLLAHKSIMLAFTAYFTFIGSWITKLCSFLLFFFQPSSIILLFWAMGVTVLGIIFPPTDVSEILLNSQLHDVSFEQ